MHGKELSKEKAIAEIMYLFRYQYKSEWAPESIFAGKDRIWIQAFNDLVKKGFILKKKKAMRNQYKWAGVWPEKY